MNVYNEIETYACGWLENLARAKHISAGTIDRRSIADITAADLRGAAQFHAFAGIGGWSYALRLSGWPDDAPVWTGSCPCQPFSVAGRRGGTDDARHLWPEWRRLIAECCPPVIFGEQVASPDGRDWLDAVSLDLEALGYAVGSADLCAAGVGAPHTRQRLWFVAYAAGKRRKGIRVQLRPREQRQNMSEATRGCGAGDVAYADSKRPQRKTNTFSRQGAADSERQPINACNADCGLGDAGRTGSRGDAGAVYGTETAGGSEGCPVGDLADQPIVAGPDNPWAAAEWIPCTDNKVRPVEPGTFPLAHGIPGRVGRLRAYGNAIVPQVAATFIRATVEAINK